MKLFTILITNESYEKLPQEIPNMLISDCVFQILMESANIDIKISALSLINTFIGLKTKYQFFENNYLLTTN